TAEQKLQSWVEVAVAPEVVDGPLVHVHLVPCGRMPEQERFDRSQHLILGSQRRLTSCIPDRRLCERPGGALSEAAEAGNDERGPPAHYCTFEDNLARACANQG